MDMEASRLYIFKWLLMGLVLISSCFSVAEYYLSPYQRTPRLSRLFTFFETNVFYSSVSFDEQGQVRYPQNPNQSCLYIYQLQCFVSMQNQLNLSYAVARWLRVAPFISIISDSVTRAMIVGKFTEGGLDVSLPIRIGKLSVLPSFRSVLPIYSLAKSRTISVHQIMRLTPSVYMHFPFHRRWFLFAKVGYEMRHHLSYNNMLLGQVGLKYRDHKWELGGLVGAMGGLPISNFRQSDTEQAFYDTGEMHYYSSNPLVLGVATWIDLRVTQTDGVYAGFKINALGKRYARGMSGIIGYKKSFMQRSRRTRYQKSSKFFKGKKENIDSLLEEDNNDQELMREIEKLR